MDTLQNQIHLFPCRLDLHEWRLIFQGPYNTLVYFLFSILGDYAPQCAPCIPNFQEPLVT